MSASHWIWQSERLIPSETGAGQRVLDEVVEKLRRSEWLHRDVFGVQLATEEALVNAIRHGNQLDPAKQVRVWCRLTPKLFRIEITDQGKGFLPASVPDPAVSECMESPNGMGLSLMRNFMTRVEYNEAGNQVVMEKHRD